MRNKLAFSFVLLLAGCGNGSLAPGGEDMAGGSGDGGGSDLAGQTPTDMTAQARDDMAMMSSDDAAGGDAAGGDAGQLLRCRSACDCPPGIACIQNMCMAVFMPVYCCGMKPCPQGAMCEDVKGNPGLCGGGGGDGGIKPPPPDGGMSMPDGGGGGDGGIKPPPLDGGLSMPDGGLRGDGGFDFCPFVDCAVGGDALCMMAGCRICNKLGGMARCSR